MRRIVTAPRLLATCACALATTPLDAHSGWRSLDLFDHATHAFD
jgi:hypothetical protein